MSEADNSHSVEKLPDLFRRLYEVVDELEAIFPGRRFTPDGHLVGSLGESIAAYRFGLTLNAASTEGYDAVSPDNLKVEIKATQGKRIALSAQETVIAERLVVLRLKRSSEVEVVYNGPAAPVWAAAGKEQKNGQRPISLARLRVLDAEVLPSDRLLPVRDF